MSSPRKLRARIAAIGLALSTLAVTFNSHAGPAPLAPPAPVITNAQTQTPPAPVQISPADQRVLTLTDELIALGRAASPDTAAVNRKLDEVVAAIVAGGDPHQRAGTMPGAVFSFLILAAGELQRPDIVETLIKSGADVKRADQGGLTAIDYALMNVTSAQRTTRSRIDASLTILKLVENAGAKITDTRLFQYMLVRSHKDLATNIVGMAALRDAGYITPAEYQAALNISPANANQARVLTDLSVAWLRANGAVLVEHPDAAPGGPEPIKIVAGETLDILARRFVHAMNAADEQDALRRIAAQNNITIDANGTPSRALVTGETILIPVPPEHSLGYTAKPKGRTLQELATHLRAIYYNPNATNDQILDDIARLNNMTRAELDAAPDDTPLLVNFHNDSYTHVQPLTPPPWAASQTGRTYMIIIESADHHGKQTYRVAMGTNFGINRQVDMSQFLNWDAMLIGYPLGNGTYTPSNAQHILLNLGDNPLRDRIIFSHSMGLTLGRINPDATRNDRAADSVTFESLRAYIERQEKSRPIIFNAAGNEYPLAGRNVPPYLVVHSPRTINIGAVGRYPSAQYGAGRPIIAPYSTSGGELCAVLPTEYGKQMEGTSFTTPMLAGTYRQFVEWYGDDLTYEEIIAAGMMTAGRDVLDLDTVNGYYRRTPSGGVQAVPALFRTNGGGLAFSERCGPGVANLALWNKTLTEMVTMKRAMIAAGQTPATMDSHWLAAGTPRVVTNAAGVTEYVYSVRMPENMTLGRLTFLVPQHAGAHSAVTVKSPAGFRVTLQHSLYETLSTHAFAYEDVKKGSAIEIRTTQPLAPSAAIIVRGHAEGNMIEALRDKLRRDGIMPAPLRTFAGATEVPSYPAPSIAIPPANNNNKKTGNPALPPAPENLIISPVPMPTITPP